MLHFALGRLHSEFRSCQHLGYSHGCPRVECWLSTGHSGCPLGQGHEYDELVLHPACIVTLWVSQRAHETFVLSQP